MTSPNPTGSETFLSEILTALDGGSEERIARPSVTLRPGGSLKSVFRVSDLAQASVGAAAAAMASLISQATGDSPPEVSVDRDLASAWFSASIRPQGWSPPPVWDAIAGDYEGADGWIRLHTNAPRHRAAALFALGLGDGGDSETSSTDRAMAAAAVRRWPVRDLESAVVEAGGAAAEMRSPEDWDTHAQGLAVAAEPLFRRDDTGLAKEDLTLGPVERPLAGLRVLDLTRVLAGPVATRLLAGWGADVLRIDPPDWDEPFIAPEVTLGKHCARLDLKTREGRDRLLALLTEADVMVHGYRADALEQMGLGADIREECRPGLVDVSLDAYGWSGPWRNRRGFDSLVQMSSGIAAAGITAAGADRPVPLPVQALDHATGYLMAVAALTGLRSRLVGRRGSRWRLSLARTARLLVDAGAQASDPADGGSAPPEAGGPVEYTTWGEALRLPPPAAVVGSPLRWDRPARALGSDPPAWASL